MTAPKQSKVATFKQMAEVFYSLRKTKIKVKERKEIFEMWAATGNFRREKR